MKADKSHNLFDLNGKVAIVTGGNGGIGLGMAQGLADAGATVMVVARDKLKNSAAVKALSARGSNAAAVEGDVTLERDCQTAVQAAVDRFQRLDILINNAGIGVTARPEEQSPADWHKVIDTNLSSAFLFSQAAYPQLKKAGGGKIINIGSMFSIFGGSMVAAYAASKGGIVQLTKSLAAAWAKDNVQVNAVLPGWIETDLSKGIRREVEGLHEQALAGTPAGRWGVPEDLAGIAVFLASAASDFVTGAAIPVDGGFSSQA